MKNGKPQHIVVYGTSLSSGGNGKAWMEAVKARLEEKYGDNLVSYTLAGKGGMWSVWGVRNFEDSVIAKKPDAVFMEFGMNDAFEEYGTSVALAKLNLAYMIDRIRLHNDSCDIFLQVMNMPIGKSASFRPHLDDYYAMYRETAQEKKVTLIDHYPNWQIILDKGEDIFRQYVPDGLHPNRKGGEEIIAPKIVEVLNLNIK
ncbi:SGNH/GDSL hydrolase family protein [Sphingobacterium phlebotomi]|uniref:SGNH/GDSL hydrolase family protein n=1 Tax=Sphingobacterium phlebotomi TaxID=2605433 RepID=UPI0016538894|nr:SGNH/GDSL hydrolase family protein [Sphingobacterium phlebotomi]